MKTWSELIQEQQNSRLSAREWCKQNYVTYQSFIYNRKDYVRNGCIAKEKEDIRWKQVIEDQMSSGLNVVDWCKSNLIAPETFYYHRRKLIKLGL